MGPGVRPGGSWAEGSYELVAQVRDAAGNLARTPSPLTVRIDTTAPDTVLESGPAEAPTLLPR